MSKEQHDSDILGTLTDALNESLHPLGILLSGLDATSILPTSTRDSVLTQLRALTDGDIIQIAQAANVYCETTQITPRHIRDAVERTKWSWQGS